jgi:hypothetical protein
MNFNHTGLFIAVLILLGMLITCHLRNYFNPRQTPRLTSMPKSDFIDLAIPTATPPIKYNKITYNPAKQTIPCEIANQGSFPCSQIQSCMDDQNPQTTQAFQLSDSEIALLYKEAYERAALEVMNRMLKNN